MQSKNTQIQTIENELEFKDVSSKFVDGVELENYQKEFLLPHFLMLLVGKPGSGKTTLLKQLITNKQMYKQKFNHIILVSPSHAKMGINIEKKYISDKFSLDWLYSHFEKINSKQMQKMFGHDMGGKQLVKDKKNITGTKKVSKTFVLNDERSRFITSDFLKKYGNVDATGVISDSEKQSKSIEQIYKEISKMPYEKQRSTHCNVLVILDDVVADIKREEMNPKLAQLVMNRRHIILNGTISIIMVTQKYTLIPARVRSNANWLVLFQLNPLDFENVYRDVVVQNLQTWRDILSFVFGKTISFDQSTTSTAKNNKQQDQLKDNGRIKTQLYTQENSVQQQNKEEEKEEEKAPKNEDSLEKFMKDKKYENIGIWVEYNIYFKNFKRLTF